MAVKATRPASEPAVAESGGLAALADDSTALALGQTAPYPVALAMGESVLEARLPDRALAANDLRLLGVFVRGRVEDLWV
jgi:hypothetical protein